ncbi:MAG TPA: serine hydrolase domain-containing protein [Thermoanaerobaculia bacterium]|nr:serine hydrolase domain-containing protein [Thermoanaerobaculia bacterium]
MRFTSKAAVMAAVLAASAGVLVAQREGVTPKAAAKTAAPAAPPAASSAPAPPEAAAAMTAADVEAFLDGLMPAQLGPSDVAGAVVVVVKDGQILFGRGYGWADVEKRVPVDWQTTLFRPGSISKLFTWTSVMQQVEKGKLDLDTDVNKYIDFKVPEAFGKPITLRDVMTHTPGYEDYAKDLIVADAKLLVPLGEHLRTHQPARIFPPGSTPAYSNYATSMAGYIVERVSGKPFADYVQENIFDPLGMTHASFQQPLPPALAPSMSSGYKVASDKARPFEIVVPSPAGALSASGADMARFMIAHLQDGRYDSAQILQPETAKLMHARQRGKSPETDGMALGFYEESRNGHRIIGHGGDTNWFHSDLHLIPDANVGFFVSYNSGGNGKGSGRTLLWNKFLDRYFPYTPPAMPRAADAKEQAKRVSGNYLVSRREDTHFLRLLYLLQQTKVAPSADDPGTIEVSALVDYNEKPKRWEPIGNGVFREVHGQEKVVFQKDPLGRDEMVTEYPFFDFFRPPAYLDASLVLPVAMVSLGVIVLALILWPLGGIVRRHYARRLQLPPGESRLRLWTRIVCLIQVAMVAGYAILIIKGLEDLDLLTPKSDPWLHVLQALAILSLVGVLIAVVNAVSAWGSRQRGVWSKLGETLIALSTIGVAWIILAGRLLHVGPAY